MPPHRGQVGVVDGALTRQPRPRARDLPGTNRRGQRGPRGSAQPLPLGGVEGGGDAGRMEPGPPEDLVAEHVPEAGHERLVHERRLELLPGGAEDREQLVAREAERVGPEVAEQVVELGVVGRQPDAAQLATVDEAQCAPIGDEGQAAEPVVIGLGVRCSPAAALLPAERAGHAQVDDDRGAVGADGQPLAPAVGGPDVRSARRRAGTGGRWHCAALRGRGRRRSRSGPRARVRSTRRRAASTSGSSGITAPRRCPSAHDRARAVSGPIVSPGRWPPGPVRRGLGGRRAGGRSPVGRGPDPSPRDRVRAPVRCGR